MIDWIDVNTKLPYNQQAVLGYCRVPYKDDPTMKDASFLGIVSVIFMVHKGWFRLMDWEPVYVLFWAEMPNAPEIVKK